MLRIFKAKIKNSCRKINGNKKRGKTKTGAKRVKRQLMSDAPEKTRGSNENGSGFCFSVIG